MELDPTEELWDLGGIKTMRTSGTEEALSSASRKLEGKTTAPYLTGPAFCEHKKTSCTLSSGAADFINMEMIISSSAIQSFQPLSHSELL